MLDQLSAVLDRKGRLEALEPGAGQVLELGCGDRKRRQDSIGVDVRDLPGVDVVGDVFDVLERIPDGSLAEVFSSHFLEHVEDLPRLLGELSRVLAVGGRMEAIVPHFSNPYFYSDPTHRRFFGLYTFSYFVQDVPFARRVPRYSGDFPFTLLEAELVFRSSRPFAARRIVKRWVGAIFNANFYMRELYEENFCHIFPCYEIRFVLEKQNPCDAGETAGPPQLDSMR